MSGATLFLVGEDYHLGDLLWLTAVIRQYRLQVQPELLLIGCPDRPISRILEHNPLIDELLRGGAASIRRSQRQRFGNGLVLHDLRVVPLAVTMLQQWRRRLPWWYYADLWLKPRGQWLATLLGLEPLGRSRPTLVLTDDDRCAVRSLPARYIVLAPHIGGYTIPLAANLWRGIKGWVGDNWVALARLLRREGYEPITLAAEGQAPVPGTLPLTGLPIRQAAAVVEQAAALITAESGLWFIAAAFDTPFVIVPWWLPRSVDWPASMATRYRLIPRQQASVGFVHSAVSGLVDGIAA